MIDWAGNPPDIVGRHMGVPLRGLRIAVPQQRLDETQVRAGFQEMGGEGVAQGMDAAHVLDALFVAAIAEDLLERSAVQGAARRCGFEEVDARLVASQVIAERGLQGGGQHDDPVLSAFAVYDLDDPAFEIQAVDFERCGFGDPEAAGVDEGERQFVLGIAEAVDYGGDALGVEDFRQGLVFLEPGNSV